jgi:hypothetical protein
VMEQRTVVQFLILKKLSARNITAELERRYRHEARSLSAVRKCRRRFLDDTLARKDDPQSGRPPQSDLCESLRALIDEAPFISGKHMCQKRRIPKTTCRCVLHEDLGFRTCYLR